MTATTVLHHCTLARPAAHALHFGLMTLVPLAFWIPLVRLRPTRADAAVDSEDDARRSRYLRAFGINGLPNRADSEESSSA